MQKVVTFANKINKWYKYLILVAIFLGGLLSPVLLFLKPFVTYLIAIMTASLALTCNRKSLYGVLREPFNLLLGWTFIFGVTPFLSYILSMTLLSSRFDVATGLILIASTPSPWGVGVWTGIAGGEVTLALSLLISSMVFSVFLTPLLMQLYAGIYVNLNFLQMSMELAYMVVLPIILVALLKLGLKRDLQRFDPVFVSSSSIAAILIGAAVGATVFPLLWQQGTIDFLPILTLTIALQVFLSFSLSHFVFRKLLKIDLKHSIALIYSIGSKNNSLAMAIALTFFSPLAAIPSVIYLITQIIASSVMLKILERENQ